VDGAIAKIGAAEGLAGHGKQFVRVLILNGRRFTESELEIPYDLIESLAEDRLVIFVGAGASAKAYPKQPRLTWFPTFKQLVYEIGDKLEKQLSAEEKRNIKLDLFDRVLGEWQREIEAIQKISIHKIAAEILSSDSDQKRTELHQAIIRLFPQGAHPRIVTTNFDTLLIQALDQEGQREMSSWKISFAPALLPAKRFTGICFLHGCVKEPNEMILTDKDIGRAYMEEGWALKFAHDMFREFDVLFIGYSLQDPPLRYLSLALEGTNNRKRWAFVSISSDSHKQKNQEEDWRRRGVEPIWYPTKRNDHRILERNITAWADDNRRGYVDRKNVLSDLARSNPSHLPPYNLDQAKYYLQTPELLRDFAKTDFDENWFDRLLDWGHLDFLLKSSVNSKEADWELASILSKRLIEDSEEWISKLHSFRKTLHPFFFEQFCREFDKNETQEFDCNNLRRLLEFFSFTINSQSSVEYGLFLKRILKLLVENNFVDDAIWVFLSITHFEGRFIKKPSFDYLSKQLSGEDVGGSVPETLEFEAEFVNANQQFHDIEGFIRTIFIPNIKNTGFPLLNELTRKFLEIRNAIKRVGAEKRTYFFRSTIEPNENNLYSHHELESIFIDSLRDIWEKLLEANLEKAKEIYGVWKDIDDTIFKRLSIHALRKILEQEDVQ